MKGFLKVFTVLAVLAGLLLILAAYLQGKETPEYISIYGGSDEEA